MRAGAAILVALALVLAAAGATRAADAAGFAGLAFEPHPGARLPLGLEFHDEAGRSVTLRRFFAGKPVVLVLEYLRCKTFCGLTLGRLAAALGKLPLAAGRDFQVVAVSIDPRDTPAEAAGEKAKYLALYRRPAAAGWHFLTGPAPAAWRLATAIGFPYRYDPVLDQYIHPAGFVLATPDGTISRYFLEIDPTPAQLASGIAAAARDEAISPVIRLILWCCQITGAPLGSLTAAIEAAFVLTSIAVGLSALAVFAAIWRRRHG
jgi:protein SCO1/2